MPVIWICTNTPVQAVCTGIVPEVLAAQHMQLKMGVIGLIVSATDPTTGTSITLRQLPSYVRSFKESALEMLLTRTVSILDQTQIVD